MIRRAVAARAALAAMTALLTACAGLPKSGPSADAIEGVQRSPQAGLIQVVELDDRVARELMSQRTHRLFSETLADGADKPQTVGRGDSVEVTIWESPPATLFAPSISDPRALASAGATTLPAQVVGSDGTIAVPFAGRIRAAGLTTQAVGDDIAARLRGKANRPEILVRVLQNASSMVTVVGDVNASIRMPLTSGGERVLDAIAAAGGVRQPINKTTVQVTRGERFESLPLDLLIRDPRQNVPLHGGDVVSAISQPLSLTVLGATGRQDEINFEVQGISLAQALARSGGLLDNRAQPEGVFVFRFERQNALAWPQQPVSTTPDGKVPVVYRLDLRDPKSFFVMQNFEMSHKDIVYVSNAPVAELQKFLNVVFSITYPVLNLINATN